MPFEKALSSSSKNCTDWSILTSMNKNALQKLVCVSIRILLRSERIASCVNPFVLPVGSIFGCSILSAFSAYPIKDGTRAGASTNFDTAVPAMFRQNTAAAITITHIAILFHNFIPFLPHCMYLPLI